MSQTGFELNARGLGRVGEALTALTAVAYYGIARQWRAMRNRRSVSQLLHWDDHMLKDIGVTRGDVLSVMAMPVTKDPSQRLTVLSVERRAALRAVTLERRQAANVVALPQSRQTEERLRLLEI